MSDGVIEVRPLVPEDAPEYVALRRAMLVESPVAFTADADGDPGSDEEQVRKYTASKAGLAIVGGFLDGKLVGAAGIVREARSKLHHRAWVWGVWTAPEVRGRGIGEAVMREVIRVVRGWEGMRVLYLSVGAEQSAAIRLYKRLGFRVWGTEPRVVHHAGRDYDEVHLALMLDAAPEKKS